MGASKLFNKGINVTVKPTSPDPESLHDVRANNEKPSNRLADTLSDKLFKKDALDRKLERHHITGIQLHFHRSKGPKKPNSLAGIAFSGAVGVGIYQTSSELIALGGPIGALLAVSLLERPIATPL